MKNLLRKLLIKLRDRLYNKMMNEKDNTDYSDIIKEWDKLIMTKEEFDKLINK